MHKTTGAVFVALVLGWGISGVASRFDQHGVATQQRVASSSSSEYVWDWGPPTSQPQVDQAFTLAWDTNHLDLNGLALNPDWSPHPSGGAPPIIPTCMHPAGNSSSTCASVPGADDGRGIKLAFCKTAGSPFPGHVNWAPSTVTGVASWGNYNDDGDYNLFLEPSKAAGLTSINSSIDGTPARQYIELEFDASETMARMATEAWTNLRSAVDEWASEPVDSSRIDALLNVNRPGAPSRAVVTGLFGLDCEHGCPSEVHPVLAVAIESNDAPDTNTWMIFARNWGNEGWCSHETHLANTTRLTILLPASLSGPPSLVSTEFASTSPQTPVPSVVFQPDRSIAVDFTLPSPQAAELVELVLHLKWTGTPNAVRSQEPAASQTRRPFTRSERNQALDQNLEHYFAKQARTPSAGAAAQSRSFLPSASFAAAPLKNTIRSVSITPTLGSFRATVSQSRAATSSTSGNLRRLRARRAANDKRLILATCRASNQRLPGLSAVESRQACRQASQ
jgi:hypothetical protein